MASSFFLAIHALLLLSSFWCVEAAKTEAQEHASQEHASQEHASQEPPRPTPAPTKQHVQQPWLQRHPAPAQTRALQGGALPPNVASCEMVGTRCRTTQRPDGGPNPMPTMAAELFNMSGILVTGNAAFLDRAVQARALDIVYRDELPIPPLVSPDTTLAQIQANMMALRGPCVARGPGIAAEVLLTLNIELQEQDGGEPEEDVVQAFCAEDDGACTRFWACRGATEELPPHCAVQCSNMRREALFVMRNGVTCTASGQVVLPFLTGRCEFDGRMCEACAPMATP